MPALYSRLDVRFSRRNRELLNKLKEEVRLRTGRSVAISKLVDEIVSDYFDRELIRTCNNSTDGQDSQREIIPPGNGDF